MNAILLARDYCLHQLIDDVVINSRTWLGAVFSAVRYSREIVSTESKPLAPSSK